jgi:phosphopantetheinyl transferase
MIGNDIVDLVLAQKESNWRREGFLRKIFTSHEQKLILNSDNPEILVWNLWSRKEAAYKIYNRQTGIRGYFPLKIACNFDDENWGTIDCLGTVYYTQTKIECNLIYTIAVTKKEDFNRIETVKPTAVIYKEMGIPFILDEDSKLKKPISITHHGRFYRCICLK